MLCNHIASFHARTIYASDCAVENSYAITVLFFFSSLHPELRPPRPHSDSKTFDNTPPSGSHNTQTQNLQFQAQRSSNFHHLRSIAHYICTWSQPSFVQSPVHRSVFVIYVQITRCTNATNHEARESFMTPLSIHMLTLWVRRFWLWLAGLAEPRGEDGCTACTVCMGVERWKLGRMMCTLWYGVG